MPTVVPSDDSVAYKVSEPALERAEVVLGHHLLRQKVVDADHSPGRPPSDVEVAPRWPLDHLLGVSLPAPPVHSRRRRRISAEEVPKLRRAFPQRGPVDDAKDTDVPSNTERSKIEVHER